MIPENKLKREALLEMRQERRKKIKKVNARDEERIVKQWEK